MTPWQVIALVAEMALTLGERLARGEDPSDLRVRDLIPASTQLMLAKAAADARATAKFGVRP